MIYKLTNTLIPTTAADMSSMTGKQLTVNSAWVSNSLAACTFSAAVGQFKCMESVCSAAGAAEARA